MLKQVKAKLQDAGAAMGTHNQADSNSEGIRELRIMVCSCNTELEENKKTIIREIRNMRLKNKTIELISQLKAKQPDKENTVLVKNRCVGIVIENEQSEENKKGAKERRRIKEEEKRESMQ